MGRVAAIKGQDNKFLCASSRFAHEFKAFCLFTPSAFADSIWVFNNPHLFYLSTVDRNLPNSIQCALNDPEFLEVYWRPDRSRRNYPNIFSTTFPDKGEGIDDASWLKDCFRMNRKLFDSEIRYRFADHFLESRLKNLSTHRTELHGAPKVLMQENMLRLLQNSDAYFTLEGYSSNEQNMARKVLETLSLEMHASYSHGRVLNRLPEIAEGPLAERLSWLLTDRVYLQAYATASGHGSAGYGPGVLSVGKLVEPPQLSGNYRGRPRILITNFLNSLSFKVIFSEEIRHSKHFERYRRALQGLSAVTDSRDRDDSLRDAVTTLIGGIGPAIYKATGQKVSSNKTIASWTVSERMLELAVVVNEIELPVVKAVYNLAKQVPAVERVIDRIEKNALRHRGRRILGRMRDALRVNLTRERVEIDDSP